MLLNPNQLKSGIQAVLKESKLSSGSGSATDLTSENRLNNLLEANGLGPEDVISQVGSMMRCAENENTRLSAAKLGLELNKMIGSKNDQGNLGPVVNIVITGFNPTEVNPILIPRVNL